MSILVCPEDCSQFFNQQCRCIVEFKKKSDKKKKKKKRSSSDKEDKAGRRRNSSSSSSRDGSHHSATKQQEQSSESGKIVSAPVDFIVPGRLDLPSSTHRSAGVYTQKQSRRHRRPPLVPIDQLLL